MCNQMVMEQRSYSESDHSLDLLFSALADPTRRAILRRLAKGAAAVGELAEPFEMSQPAVSKHLKVLEGAGLITRTADRQRRLANLNATPMKAGANFIHDFAAYWEGNLDALDALLTTLQKGDTQDD
ncbi:metalloregulator ArsR/SmtB family transcription factor [Celeribacter arenosi]|uniref:Metalloregulator ArsR/SmtB family transcription factor n=1 Tax=Celeribacter arenosi TaxID=792649 RepID=A0ABP7KEE0_9RHOB